MGHDDGFKIAGYGADRIGEGLPMAFMGFDVVRWVRPTEFVVALYECLCKITLYKDIIVNSGINI